MPLTAPLWRIALVALLALSGAVAAIASIAPASDAELLLEKAAKLEPLAIHAEAALLPAPATYIREERLQSGETLPALLSRLGLAADDAQKVLRLREFRGLRPGTTVTAEVRAGAERDGELVWLEYLAPRDQLVRIERVGQGVVASEKRARIETRVEMRSAVIRSSLFAASDEAGIPDAIATQLADVFGSDIDFHRELRRGDRFTVTYEVHSVGGRALRAGRVLAAEFVNQGKAHRAVWYVNSYYTPEGRNLRKAFLRSPLELSRVTSGFGMRMHPFLQTWRAHRGVDYAAPVGTRVRAVSDGIVEFAGRQGGYGNLVIIRHDARHETYYAHLNSIGKAVRKGARIAQGDTVGTVGQTGWATGPHLHYEFRIAGEARNPLALALPPAAPIAAGELERFRSVARPLAAQLDLYARRTQLAAADADAPAFE